MGFSFHDKATDLSVMPWVITSQTIPILALAPMIIVVLSSIGFTGLMPKAVISMYLSFFPIVVGMVKGLRSPDLLEIDQMKTWSASRFQILIKLRLPKSIPFLFTSLKLGMAASLVGAHPRSDRHAVRDRLARCRWIGGGGCCHCQRGGGAARGLVRWRSECRAASPRCR